MRTLFYSTKVMERTVLAQAAGTDHEVCFSPDPLNVTTAADAKGFNCISIFTGDDASAPVLERLKDAGIKYIALRATGFDNVDLPSATRYGIRVANVPGYSPFAVAEHAVALIQALNRKIIKGQANIRDNNFTVDDLVGFDLNGKTVGIIGTGRIGSVFARIMHGFGCRLLGSDIVKDASLVQNYQLNYVSLDELYSKSDIISLHTPLNKHTAYMLNKQAFDQMKTGVMIINTARGGLVKTTDLLLALEDGKIGYYGTDVYEHERGIFFNDLSDGELKDALLSRMLSLPNVLVTPHQAFATKEALNNIATAVFYNIGKWSRGLLSGNELNSEKEPLHEQVTAMNIPALTPSSGA